MPGFELLTFTPFRLNRLAAEVSAELAGEYRERHGLDIPEWRVLATLGYRGDAKSAQDIVRCTRTHKSTISRAVTALIGRKLIARVTNTDDRREQTLRLTARGRALFEALVPNLLQKEQAILSCFSVQERKVFAGLLDKLEASLDLIRTAEESDSRNGNV